MNTLKSVIAATTGKGRVILAETDLFIQPWYFTLSSKPYVLEESDSITTGPTIPNWFRKDVIIEKDYGTDTTTVSPLIGIQIEDRAIIVDDGAIIGPLLGTIKVSELINYEPESSVVAPTQPAIKYSVGTVNKEKEDVSVSPIVGFEII